MTCLASVARQIVRQTPYFSQGQTYVLPLLMAVLPGIDSNDFKKTAVTFQFLNAILMLVTCVDCSSAVNTRDDLTEVRRGEKDLVNEIFMFFNRLKRKFVYQQRNSKISSLNF
jgi:hypothetical protein